jgi:sulfite reductase beta subunit-like hemoprotein|uniref:Uncharacterized protein n=1 Tax=viral metagenome TaxID=1070528 RepID=A0A6C0IQS1_9ZZZZ
MDIQEIFEQAKRDPSLLSNINIDELLEDTNDVKNDYLQDKTLGEIKQEIYDVLEEEVEDTRLIEKYMERLSEYRYVDEVGELHNGKHIRWVRRGNDKLTNGGIVVEVKFVDNGINVLCKNAMHKFIQFKYDDCVIFQKLSIDEQLILNVNQHVHAENN